MSPTMNEEKQLRSYGTGHVGLRGRIYWATYYVRGKRYQVSCKTDNINVAKRFLTKKLGAAANGRPVGPRIEKTTFADLAVILINDLKANSRKIKKKHAPLEHARTFFGDHELAINITNDRLVAFVAHRQDEGAASATINRSLAALRRALRLALRAGRVATVPHFPMLREKNARTGFFEHDEFASVLKHLPDYLQPVMETAYITGWRVPSELLTREWRHLDLDAGWLRLEPGETKNGEGRNFPVTPKLRDILTAQLERTKASGKIISLIFHRDGKPIGDFYDAWHTAADAAGLPLRIPHDFRRTAVRNLERAGIPRSAAMKMTGHLTESVYRRYAIVDAAMLQEAAAKLDALHTSDAARPSRPPKVVPLHRAS